MNKKYFLICFLLVLAFSFVRIDAQAERVRPVDEALAWVASLEGQVYDYDGQYGGQCVDLIMGYYAHLGVSPVGGNANDYATNSLPTGWQRIAGGEPQPGDILVYSATSTSPSYGHVAIYAGGNTIWHGKYGAGIVQKTTNINYQAVGTYWGVIRPNWAPFIESVKVTDVSSDGYTVEIVATDDVGMKSVCCPTWTEANGQDDLFTGWDVNAVATHVSGDTYIYRVNVSEHNNESGKYITHVYAYDIVGMAAMVDVAVEVPEQNTTTPPTDTPSKPDIIKSESASFISRCDGIWLWPTPAENYRLNDWAGCNGGPGVTTYCQFCADRHQTWCEATHYDRAYGHAGLDIDASVGTSIYASANGILYSANSDSTNRGIYAVVEHPIEGTNWSYYSVYEHLNSVVTDKIGKSVVAGEVIAYSGATNGAGTGQPHLHFQIIMSESGQGNTFAQNSGILWNNAEVKGWLTVSGFTSGRIVSNPALNSPAGDPAYVLVSEFSARTHAGSVMYTFNPSEVSIGENRACEHNYTSTEIPATCTDEGALTYTCSSCGDTYFETIAVLGHDYVGVKTEPTCNSIGYTTFTCSRCGDNYVENSDGWSEWSEEYPIGVSEELIEEKIQYSTLGKEFTTSDSETLEGWINCGTTYTDWSEVQTTTTQPIESKELRITNTVQTGWGYYHYCNYYANGGNNWNVDSIPYGSPNYWHSWISNVEMPAYAFPDKGGQQAYGGSGSGAAACAYNCYIWFRNAGADTYSYTYQTRSELNQFYRWSDEWSAWTDKEIVADDDVDVKTRTVYRYYAGDFAEHDYSYVVTKDPTSSATGTLSGTCSACQDTTTVTLPKFSLTDYTYSEVEAPSYTETGMGRYIWNTTTYGSFSFDVTLDKLVNENAPQIVVLNAKGFAGDTVTVTVNLKNNPGFSGLNMYLTYSDDLKLIEASNVITDLTFTNDATMVWDAASDYSEDGELLKLTFAISEEAEVGEHFVKVHFIEAYTAELDDVTFITVDGIVEVVDFTYGDANGDNEINTKDIILIRRHVAAKNPTTGESTVEAKTGADANGDGVVNTKDIILVRRYVAAKNPVTGESSVVLGPNK